MITGGLVGLSQDRSSKRCILWFFGLWLLQNTNKKPAGQRGHWIASAAMDIIFLGEGRESRIIDVPTYSLGQKTSQTYDHNSVKF